jgi:hypothetical protein
MIAPVFLALSLTVAATGEPVVAGRDEARPPDISAAASAVPILVGDSCASHADAALATLRRLLRHGCEAEAVQFAAEILPTLPWDKRLAALDVAAEVPAGTLRLDTGRLALAEAIVARLGEPPAGADAPRRAALAAEALYTIACLQPKPPPPDTFGSLFGRFVATQGPDPALTRELLAMRRIYLRWRFRVDCAAGEAESRAVLDAVREL